MSQRDANADTVSPDTPAAALAERRPGLVAMTWPLFVELLLGTLVGMAGLALAAHVSDAAAGAFTLSNHVQQAFFLLFRVISMGVSVVITQQLGAGDRAGADRSARAAIGASTWLALGAGIAVAAGAGSLLALLNAPDPVLLLGRPYLQMLAIGLALDAYNASMASVMRAHLHARDTLVNMIVMHLLHLALCIPLMGGAGPLPAMGLAGFAVAMAISRAFGIAFHLWLWRRRLGLVPRRHDWWVLRGRRLGPVLHIGLPGAAENIGWRVSFMFTVAIAARYGEQALATHGYVVQMQMFIALFSIALGFATEILVGHMIGGGRLHEADRLVRKSLRWGLTMSSAGALVAALTAPWTLQGFTHDAQILHDATTLLWLSLLIEPGRVFNLVVINGLRATGDARFPVAAGILSMLLVMAGGGWLLAVHFEMGLPGLWLAYAADEWLRGLMMAARWKWRGWLPHARQTHRRVQRQRRRLQG